MTAASEPARIHPRLPVFRVAPDVLYAPGMRVIEAAGEEARADQLRELERVAARADCAWQERAEAAFLPECLTVYLSNLCNLGCSYCYAAVGAEGRAAPPPTAGRDRFPLLSETTVRAAAEVVARHCAAKERPFTLVAHGGGEPTLHWELLQRVVAATRETAGRAGLGWWGYVATNGILAEERARWLARNFDLVGLSCDGPPEIQDAQRSLTAGGSASRVLEQTARTLADEGAAFVVRVTVTPATVARQAEIVEYVHAVLGASEIRLEPAYSALGGGVSFPPEQAEPFVEGFLSAQRRADALGCAVNVSGVRPGEVHGPYCNVLRDVLHLTPDGAATACFLTTDGRAADGEPMVIGRHGDGFELDAERIAALRRRAMATPDACRDCVNVYHCARDCPDVCPAAEGADPSEAVGGFRCRVQKALSHVWIRDGRIGHGS